MISGKSIYVRASPGIEQAVRAPDVGPIPTIEVHRLRKKRLEAFLLRGVSADIEFVEIEIRRKVVNLNPRGIDLRAAQIFQDLRCGDCGKQAENHKHD